MSTHAAQRTAGVVVSSTRAAAGIYQDTSAPVLSQWLAGQGFHVIPARVVSDGAAVAEALRELLAVGPSVILTTGGTGLSADDLTPEMTLPLLERQIPGVMEAIRAAGAAATPLAALSRGYAGTAGKTLIVNLPGSAGGIKDGLRVLEPLIGHLCDQLEGSHEH
ncbi:MogA/MoaB family molybdenum cofactor biosynthesis protein [Pseudarthrobacter sp. P1]|uniref:MogA/MoaB family molybdenum cofactor biosynthesis protein n=1 Tax=Pseudarthrobacter sp. P1 TaxID=3418418 RepID=UPI003CED4F1B